jgi:sugar lactone lactonase YvrE
MAMDGSGNLFVADTGNNRVVELSSAGGGFGTPVSVLNGLSGPMGVAADWNGSVYVSDTGNHRILKLSISAEGLQPATTIASGLSEPAGLAVDTAGNVFVADAGNNTVVEIGWSSGNYGAPVVVGSGFNAPRSVAVDAAKSLFVADTGNHRVVKEPLLNGGYSTQQVLWPGEFTPVGIFIDKNNDAFIADGETGKVSEWTWFAFATRYSSLIAVGSSFSEPGGVLPDASGNVYVADTGSNRVVEVMSGSQPFGSVQVGSSGSMITFNFKVSSGTTVGGVRIDFEGASGKDFVDAGGSSCSVQAFSATEQCGVNVQFAPRGPGLRMGSVALFDGSGNSLATGFLAGTGVEPRAAFIPGSVSVLGTQLSGPSGVAVDGSGNLYIADTGNNRVVELPWLGGTYGQQIVLPVAGLNSPMGLAIDGAGNLYIASNGNDKVVRLPSTQIGFGTASRFGNGFYGPTGVAVDAWGGVYVSNTLDQQIDKFTWTGSGFSAVNFIGSYTKAPTGLGVNGMGDVYFSDPYNNTIAQLPWMGSAYLRESFLAGVATVFPVALAVDGNSNLYVLDSSTNKLTMLPWTGSSFGEQITVANGFNAPTAVTIDGNGVLYVADTGNNQVVRIDLSQPSMASFANTFLGSTSVDSPQTVLVENLGNQSLVLNSISYPMDFPESGANLNPCADGIALGSNSGCGVSLDFTPTVIGSPLTEVLRFEDNSLNAAGSEQVVPLSGTSEGRASQSILFQPISNVSYGGQPITLVASASSGLPVTFQVVSGPGALTQNGQQLSILGVGTVVVEAVQGGNQGFAAASSVQQSIAALPAVLTVTPLNVTAVYGAIPTVFQYAITGFVHGDSVWSATTGQPSIGSNGVSSSGIGSYSLTALQGTLVAPNYTFAFGSGTLTVTPAILQLSANSFSQTYGSSIPKLTWQINGFVHGDSAALLSGLPNLSSIANSGSPVGQYPIVIATGTLAAANYVFHAVSGLLTVNHQTLVVSGQQQSAVYGSGVPALRFAVSGFVNGDTAANVIQGSPSLGTSAGANPAVGEYAIVVGAGTLAAVNYRFACVNGQLWITKAVLTVSPSNATMVYGGQVPGFTYGVSGLVNGDTAATVISGSPQFMSGGQTNSAVGTYAISMAIGTLTARNYSFQFQTGSLTITKAPLMVTADSYSIVAGGKIPTLGFVFAGWVGGDTVSSATTGLPNLATTASVTSPAGSYPIVITPGSLTAGNYALTMVNGTLTITVTAARGPKRRLP